MQEHEEQSIVKISEEVSQLRDLFVRRLSEDKAKAQIYDALVEQNAILNKQLEEKRLESLFKELLLICDRIETSEEQTDFLNSIYEEILEVFARREIFQIEVSRTFNPQYHKAVGTVPATEEQPHGKVVNIRRSGYCIKDRILRPAEVIVAANPRTEG